MRRCRRSRRRGNSPGCGPALVREVRGGDGGVQGGVCAGGPFEEGAALGGDADGALDGLPGDGDGAGEASGVRLSSTCTVSCCPLGPGGDGGGGRRGCRAVSVRGGAPALAVAGVAAFAAGAARRRPVESMAAHVSTALPARDVRACPCFCGPVSREGGV